MNEGGTAELSKAFAPCWGGGFFFFFGTVIPVSLGARHQIPDGTGFLLPVLE